MTNDNQHDDDEDRNTEKLYKLLMNKYNLLSEPPNINKLNQIKIENEGNYNINNNDFFNSLDDLIIKIN